MSLTYKRQDVRCRRHRTSDVGGMFSATNIKKTVIDSRVVMPIDTFPSDSAAVTSSVPPIDTFSPESLGT